eukprot:1769917-Rhodomonas_salina.1
MARRFVASTSLPLSSSRSLDSLSCRRRHSSSRSLSCRNLAADSSSPIRSTALAFSRSSGSSPPSGRRNLAAYSTICASSRGRLRASCSDAGS